MPLPKISRRNQSEGFGKINQNRIEGFKKDLPHYPLIRISFSFLVNFLIANSRDIASDRLL